MNCTFKQAQRRQFAQTPRWRRSGRTGRAAAREARRARGQQIGRPKTLDKSKATLAQRMHASGESASTIAATLGVSRATVYRVLAEQTEDGD
jgi:DNA invertase Pin-like site-specific DNA recombinase